MIEYITLVQQIVDKCKVDLQEKKSGRYEK